MKLKCLLWIGVLAFGALRSSVNLSAQIAADYKISPSDVLVVEIVGEINLPKEFRVSLAGTISFPYLDTVSVAGKTAAEIKDELTELLDKDYFVNPQLIVDVKEYRVREVFVNGQVNKPGAVTLPGEQKLTIIDAISRAGGLTARGNPNKIKFARPGQPEKTFSMDQLKKDLSDPDKTISVQPGDVIEVTDKLF
jgi:protein involved in polysaccharide export with SLBB domain